MGKQQARDRLQELREHLAMSEAECTRNVIEADRMAGDTEQFDIKKYDDVILEARKHARIAAQIKRQMVTLGAEAGLAPSALVESK